MPKQFISVTMNLCCVRTQGYFGSTIKVLQAICKTCGRVLLPPRQRTAWAKLVSGRNRERTANKAAVKAILLECKKATQCPHCLAYNGPVRKMAASFKVLHEPFAKKVRGCWACCW